MKIINRVGHLIIALELKIDYNVPFQVAIEQRDVVLGRPFFVLMTKMSENPKHILTDSIVSHTIIKAKSCFE